MDPRRWEILRSRADAVARPEKSRSWRVPVPLGGRLEDERVPRSRAVRAAAGRRLTRRGGRGGGDGGRGLCRDPGRPGQPRLTRGSRPFRDLRVASADQLACLGAGREDVVGGVDLPAREAVDDYRVHRYARPGIGHDETADPRCEFTVPPRRHDEDERARRASALGRPVTVRGIRSTVVGLDQAPLRRQVASRSRSTAVGVSRFRRIVPNRVAFADLMQDLRSSPVADHLDRAGQRAIRDSRLRAGMFDCARSRSGFSRDRCSPSASKRSESSRASLRHRGPSERGTERKRQDPERHVRLGVRREPRVVDQSSARCPGGAAAWESSPSTKALSAWG
jgi:hypothetical protein